MGNESTVVLVGRALTEQSADKGGAWLADRLGFDSYCRAASSILCYLIDKFLDRRTEQSCFSLRHHLRTNRSLFAPQSHASNSNRDNVTTYLQCHGDYDSTTKNYSKSLCMSLCDVHYALWRQPFYFMVVAADCWM